MAQTQESGYPDAPTHSPLEGPIAGAVGESGNREIKAAPATLGEALELAHSQSVQQALRTAGWIAVSRSQDQPSVDSRDLLVAALQTGRDKPPRSAVGSLFSWIAERNGKALFDFLERAVPPGDDNRDLSAVSLTKRARSLLSRALLIARKTAGRNDYDGRHIIAGLILPDPNGSNEDVLELGREELGINLGEFAGSFLSL
jgi:hypothetical protein